MYDSVGVPNIGEELIAQSFTVRGTLDDACDVDELHGGRNHLDRLVYPSEYV